MVDNQPQITEAIRNVLKDDYNYDTTVCAPRVNLRITYLCNDGVQNSFYALYRSFTECVFVEEDGDIVFYKNGNGEVARHLASEVSQHRQETECKPEIHES